MITDIRKLLTSVDVLNTLHGGISEPYLSFNKQSNSRTIRARVPGIDREALQIEINRNVLTVYYMLSISSNGELIKFPQVIHQEILPYFIDIRSIKASYEQNDLIILLPFNELRDGYNRKVEASKE